MTFKSIEQLEKEIEDYENSKEYKKFGERSIKYLNNKTQLQTLKDVLGLIDGIFQQFQKELFC